MKKRLTAETFSDKYPYLGPAMWILSFQYFMTQLIVASDWFPAYSFSKNTISDLGNTSCGLYDGRYICSPLHSLMNSSFIILGLFMASGSLLIYQEFKETKLALLGFSFLLLGGVGTIVVGLFPENTIDILHQIGALLPFLVGNLGISILGYRLEIPLLLRIFSLFVGIVSLIGLVFFVSNHYLDIGVGGMERIAAYPQTIWLIVFGLYMSRRHFIQDN